MNATQEFRTVRRGFDPAQVEEHLTRITKLHTQAVDDAADKTVQIAQLEAELDQLRGRVEELQDQLAAAPTPATLDYSELGPRISQMLQLAEDEAAEIRATATAEADQLAEQTRQSAEQQRADADLYAQETRSRAEAEATRIIESARTESDDLLDHADREASARRREAEALYEQQRAAAAAAAADFEATLVARRESATEEFAAQMSAQEKSLEAAREELATAEAEAVRVREEAGTAARNELARAEQEAREVLDSARNHAERVRRDSERELAALASRRDAITDQLTNVRQMLATLGGSGALAALSEAVAEEPVAEEPATGSEDA